MLIAIFHWKFDFICYAAAFNYYIYLIRVFYWEYTTVNKKTAAPFILDWGEMCSINILSICLLGTDLIWGIPGGSVGKRICLQCRRPGFNPGLGRSPGEGDENLLQYSFLKNPHGQRSLAGCSPWGRKELDTAEQLSTAQWFDLKKKWISKKYKVACKGYLW